MSSCPTSKTELYNGLVSDAAMVCIRDVVAKSAKGFSCRTPLDYTLTPAWSALRAKHGFRPSHQRVVRLRFIKRSIDAADGQPPMEPVGRFVHVHDALTARSPGEKSRRYRRRRAVVAAGDRQPVDRLALSPKAHLRCQHGMFWLSSWPACRCDSSACQCLNERVYQPIRHRSSGHITTDVRVSTTAP